MTALDNLNSAATETVKDVGTKARHGAHVVATNAQKGSQQVAEQTRSGLRQAQIGITIGSALFQSLLHYYEKKARKNLRQATHQAHHAQHVAQEKLQPVWSKTQDVAQNSLEFTQDAVQGGLEITQATLQKNVKRAQKNLKKAQKDLKHMQKAAQENLESGWNAVQDKWEEGSQQVRENLTRVGGIPTDVGHTMQKRYKHYQRKRARARALFRWGLVIGFALALLFTPVRGAETRNRIKLLWERYKGYTVRNSEHE